MLRKGNVGIKLTFAEGAPNVVLGPIRPSAFLSTDVRFQLAAVRPY